jgi:hypothetical protein
MSFSQCSFSRRRMRFTDEISIFKTKSSISINLGNIFPLFKIQISDVANFCHLKHSPYTPCTYEWFILQGYLLTVFPHILILQLWGIPVATLGNLLCNLSNFIMQQTHNISLLIFGCLLNISCAVKLLIMVTIFVTGIVGIPCTSMCTWFSSSPISTNRNSYRSSIPTQISLKLSSTSLVNTFRLYFAGNTMWCNLFPSGSLI